MPDHDAIDLSTGILSKLHGKTFLFVQVRGYESIAEPSMRGIGTIGGEVQNQVSLNLNYLVLPQLHHARTFRLDFGVHFPVI